MPLRNLPIFVSQSKIEAEEMDKDLPSLDSEMVALALEGTHKGSPADQVEAQNITFADWAFAIKTKGFRNLLVGLMKQAFEVKSCARSLLVGQGPVDLRD